MGPPYSTGTSCWNTKESKVVIEDAGMNMSSQGCGTSHSAVHASSASHRGPGSET
jgi:hypothetical protein